jgi:hypothetical protein
MSFDNCNSAELHLQPILAGFEDISLNMTRILPTTCGGGGVSSDALPWMGAFYDSARDGEGFHFGVEENGIYVMTWYTYLDGVQVWMIGTGTRNGNRVVFEMTITSGADWGSDFDMNDVVRTTFGTITVDFSDCNHFTATVDTELAEFHDLVLNVEKIIAGTCP